MNISNIKFSIIIPFKDMNPQLERCIQCCLEQECQNFEIILLPDQEIDVSFGSKVKIIPTGPVKPSRKRNIGIKESVGEILAFVDSDAYPVPTWLKNSLPHFNDSGVGGVGGPNLTPSHSTRGQKVSGLIFSSPVGAGQVALRYRARQKFRKGLPVKEMPSCNLLVKRNLALQVRGFDESLLTGEDSKFCFQIRKLHKKIIYVPDVVVYHERRDLWKPHFRQVWNYGRDKAWVIKDDFSLDKLYYFIPFTFLLFLFFGTIGSLFSIVVAKLFLGLLALYLIIMFVTSLFMAPRLAFLLFAGIFLTHIIYGSGFCYGLVNVKS